MYWTALQPFDGGVAPGRAGSGLAPTDAQPEVLSYEASLHPRVKGLWNFASTSLAFLPLLQKEYEVPAG